MKKMLFVALFGGMLVLMGCDLAPKSTGTGSGGGGGNRPKIYGTSPKVYVAGAVGSKAVLKVFDNSSPFSGNFNPGSYASVGWVKATGVRGGTDYSVAKSVSADVIPGNGEAILFEALDYSAECPNPAYKGMWSNIGANGMVLGDPYPYFFSLEGTNYCFVNSSSSFFQEVADDGSNVYFGFFDARGAKLFQPYHNVWDGLIRDGIPPVLTRFDFVNASSYSTAYIAFDTSRSAEETFYFVTDDAGLEKGLGGDHGYGNICGQVPWCVNHSISVGGDFTGRTPSTPMDGLSPYNSMYYKDSVTRTSATNFSFGFLAVANSARKVFFTVFGGALSNTSIANSMVDDSPWINPTDPSVLTNWTGAGDPPVVLSYICEGDILADGSISNVHKLSSIVNQPGLNIVMDITEDGQTLYVAHEGINVGPTPYITVVGTQVFLNYNTMKLTESALYDGFYLNPIWSGSIIAYSSSQF